MKKDFEFLDFVIVFDNFGKTIDRYTIIFKDGISVGSSARPNSPTGFWQHGEVKYDMIDFSGADGRATHTTDKDEIKAINEANKHLGKYKTINAMKRLPKEVLDNIKEEVFENDVILTAEGDYSEWECSGTNLSFEDWARIEYKYDDKTINIIKSYTNYIK